MMVENVSDVFGWNDVDFFDFDRSSCYQRDFLCGAVE